MLQELRLKRIIDSLFFETLTVDLCGRGRLFNHGKGDKVTIGTIAVAVYMRLSTRCPAISNLNADAQWMTNSTCVTPANHDIQLSVPNFPVLHDIYALFVVVFSERDLARTTSMSCSFVSFYCPTRSLSRLYSISSSGVKSCDGWVCASS